MPAIGRIVAEVSGGNDSVGGSDRANPTKSHKACGGGERMVAGLCPAVEGNSVPTAPPPAAPAMARMAAAGPAECRHERMLAREVASGHAAGLDRIAVVTWAWKRRRRAPGVRTTGGKAWPSGRPVGPTGRRSSDQTGDRAAIPPEPGHCLAPQGRPSASGWRRIVAFSWSLSFAGKRSRLFRLDRVSRDSGFGPPENRKSHVASPSFPTLDTIGRFRFVAPCSSRPTSSPRKHDGPRHRTVASPRALIRGGGRREPDLHASVGPAGGRPDWKTRAESTLSRSRNPPIIRPLLVPGPGVAKKTAGGGNLCY